jgi:hypothetical protein
MGIPFVTPNRGTSAKNFNAIMQAIGVAAIASSVKGKKERLDIFSLLRVFM